MLATQAKVAPGVEDEPLKDVDELPQGMEASSPAAAFGGVLFKVTTAKSVAVQPLAGLVTVKV